MSDDPATDAWKKFLESTPPNTSMKISSLALERPVGVNHFNTLPKLRIQLHCDIDGGPRWFDGPEFVILKEQWEYRFISYKCRDCGRWIKTYAVLITRMNKTAVDVEVMKLGEYPPFAAPISKRVQRLLQKDDLDLYRKGTRSEAQGLGIGAATYFRRIVDNKWKLFVTEIRDAAAKLGVKDLRVFESALTEVQFSKAVDTLRDAIPQKLLILDGENPLTLLYKATSVGLHELTDEQCMQQAEDIRWVLTALLENIAEVLKDQNELKGAVERLKQQKP